MVQTKCCRTCRETKSVSAFYRDRKRWATDCKVCFRANQRAYNQRPENRRHQRVYDLQRKYGLTLADYDRLVSEQRGLCAICARPPSGGKGNRLYVDHCHAEGRVRGLLCSRCNVALGYLRECPMIAQSLVTYVRERC